MWPSSVFSTAGVAERAEMGFRRLVFVAMGLAVAAGLIAWAVRPSPVATPAWVADYDLTARTPELLPPGTIVGQSAPAGWSHLVIKSLPRVRPDEESKVPPLARSQTVRMTRWMFTAFAADVRQEAIANETRHHLRAVALGLGTSVGGRDVIITPETAAANGVQLDWITETILKKGYETQRLAMVVIHGPTFGLVDTPVWYRCGQTNRLIRFRYALLVDRKTGRLDTLVWSLDTEGSCGDPTVAGVLAPDTINEAELIPDSKGFDLLGIAADAAFGVDRLPPHKARLLLPDELRPLTITTKFTPEDARALEVGLRRLLASTAP